MPSDPKGTLPPITPGTNSCNSCDTPIGNYVAVAQSDIHGKFTMTGVPATNNVPFVVQIGKWRRRVFLKTVQACTDNAVPASASRLPASHLEGDMPQMAIATGEADNLGCFLHDIGIADRAKSRSGHRRPGATG